VIPRVPLREALSDPNLLGTAIGGDSWSSWRTLLIAAMGEELHEDEREIFSKLTGRDREPRQRVDQFAAVIGRRGGKSRAMATLACYLAGLCQHSDALVPGERGVLLCVALERTLGRVGSGAMLGLIAGLVIAARDLHPVGEVAALAQIPLGGPVSIDIIELSSILEPWSRAKKLVSGCSKKRSSLFHLSLVVGGDPKFNKPSQNRGAAADGKSLTYSGLICYLKHNNDGFELPEPGRIVLVSTAAKERI
jgi:hypothetical protein